MEDELIQPSEPVKKKTPSIIKIGIHYIATSESKDGLIKIGTPVTVDDYKTDSGEKYALFGIGRVGRSEKKNQRNDVRHLTENELCDALEGVTVTLDQKYARDRVDTLMHEIAELEKMYKLIPE